MEKLKQFIGEFVTRYSILKKAETLSNPVTIEFSSERILLKHQLLKTLPLLYSGKLRPG